MTDPHPSNPTQTSTPRRERPRRIQFVAIDLERIRLDGGTQSRVALDLETVAEYADNYDSKLPMPPAVVFEDAQGVLWLADGFHRWHAARRAGLGRLACQVRPGDRIDALRHSLGANADHGLRRSNADKRRAVGLAFEHEAELAERESRPSLSDRAIARLCAVSNRFVSTLRRDQTVNVHSSERTVVKRDGTTYALDTANIGQSASQRASHSEEPRRPTPASPVRLTDARVLHSSVSNEWYTPAEYVEAARELMGGIDLDPASCALANETVKAGRFFSKEDDGFGLPWSGRVWMNPPFGLEDGESNQGRWTARLIERFEAGEVSEAVFLTNATTDRSWFKAFWRHAICFVDKRIAFFSPDGQKMQPTHGNVLVYLGDNIEGFIQLFRPFGQVVIPACVGLSEVVA